MLNILFTLLLVEVGLRSLSPSLVLKIKDPVIPLTCGAECAAYQNWLGSDPENSKSIEQWKDLWSKFHADKRSQDRMFSPPLLNRGENFYYPPGERSFVIKNDSGHVIQEVKVNINDKGFRVTTNAENKEPKETFIFLGDSFTFGYGVADNDTFPSRFAKFNPNSEVYNLGRINSGPNDFLYHLRDRGNFFLPKVRTETITIVYTYIRDQVGRTFMSNDFADISGPKDFLNKPFYEYADEKLKLKDMFYDHQKRMSFLKIFNWSALHRILGYQWPIYTKDDIPAFAAFFKELKEYSTAQFPHANVNFYFVAYPFRLDNPTCDLLAHLNKSGVRTINFGNTLLDDILPKGTQRIPTDWHPTPLSHLLYARMLSDYFLKPSDNSNWGCNP